MKFENSLNTSTQKKETLLYNKNLFTFVETQEEERVTSFLII